ncbi:AMP-binding protein [Psychrobacillus sp. L4]|uniref:AMP-binding protein n=1 Tax=Psychrobacillus sp. L4 TaxID=3236892 RepID=UPI0036F3FAC9
MSFFWDLDHPKDNTAFIYKNTKISYGELQQEIDFIKRIDQTEDKKKLIFLLCENNTIESICAYLAALQMRHVVCLLSQNLVKNNLTNLIRLYQPEWIISSTQLTLENSYIEKIKRGMFHYLLEGIDIYPLHKDLAILLNTSGSTGSCKMVKLSYKNLQDNASSIVKYLQLSNEERPVLTLPMFYSYGLSIINSHLLSGASILISSKKIISKCFWEECKFYSITSFSGVPYTYEILSKIKFQNINIKSLRTMTQAGGRVNRFTRDFINTLIVEKNINFYYMYGQTEATARISYIPPEKALLKGDSIGYAIPDGHLELDENNQLIYKGPNVMLGYCKNRMDLKKGDEKFGILETGDLGEIDDEGYFYIRGRIKRIAKLNGTRINLDEIETLISDVFGATCYSISNDEKIFLIMLDDHLNKKIMELLTERYGFYKSWIVFFNINENTIPRLINGKVNYTKLKELFNF